jgi:hypothetical protein
MNRHKLGRPSLKITRHAGQSQPACFVVEVWNPFVSAYQAVLSVQEGLRRVGELSDLISQMWLQRHPKLAALADVPNAAAVNGERWAEFRISGTTFRSCDTRNDERSAWIRAPGMDRATSITCGRVGHESPMAPAS